MVELSTIQLSLNCLREFVLNKRENGKKEINCLILPETSRTKKRESAKREIDLKYSFIKHIGNSKKKVQIRNMETYEVVVYPSMYKAAKVFNLQ